MGQALTEREIESVVREVTDEEVAFYEEYGLVMMKQLVDPEFATELLSVGQAWLEQNDEEKRRRETRLAMQEEAEPFRSFVFSQRMSKNAMRLINRKRLKGVDLPLRYRTDVFREKPPGAAVTQYHQDSAQHGSDRVGELQFWLAMVEVTPEMSAMRFVSRSHREGPLGSIGGDGQGDLLKQFPNLTSVLELSPPFYYQPGDCTVHHGYTIHGAPVNTTDKSRWSFLFSYSPADTRYWNGTADNWGNDRKRLSDEKNPMLYFPDSEEV